MNKMQLQLYRALFIFVFVFFYSCSPDKKQEYPKLIQYPLPFFERQNQTNSTAYNGIETQHYTLIKKKQEVWLLYDKRVNPDQNINFANFDEYTFIQLDLQKQLQELLKHTNNSYILGGIDDVLQTHSSVH